MAECLNCGRDLVQVEGRWVHDATRSEVCYVVYANPALP